MTAKCWTIHAVALLLKTFSRPLSIWSSYTNGYAGWLDNSSKGRGNVDENILDFPRASQLLGVTSRLESLVCEGINRPRTGYCRWLELPEFIGGRYVVKEAPARWEPSEAHGVQGNIDDGPGSTAFSAICADTPPWLSATDWPRAGRFPSHGAGRVSPPRRAGTSGRSTNCSSGGIGGTLIG